MEIMYKRNRIFEKKIAESRKYKGMKNDTNWPHEKDISCTINCPICEGSTKDKKFTHLSPHCVLHIYNPIVLSAFVVAENLFHLN